MTTKRQDDSAVKDKTEIKTQRPKMYKVLVLNDDYTPMDFVVNLLSDVFNLAHNAAMARMLEIHKKGSADFGPFTLDVAETKVDEVVSKAQRAEHPLKATFEPA